MIDYKVIGKRIQYFRLKYQFTQEYLAEKIGVSIPHLSRIENGSGKPSLQTLVDICNVLNITIDDLMQENINATRFSAVNKLEQLTSECTPDEVSMLTDIWETIRLQYGKK